MRKLTCKVDDPYIRAVLVRIGGDDWEGILAEEAIPLLDRVVIAVCNLSDKEVSRGFYRRHILYHFWSDEATAVVPCVVQVANSLLGFRGSGSAGYCTF